MFHKLRLILMLSTLLALLSTALSAHEVTPTIADLSVEGGEVTLVLRLNAEAYLSGIDLDGVENTNDTPQSNDYDALRALTPAELEARLAAFVPGWAETIEITADGQTVPLTLASAEAGEVGDIELPRITQLTLRGPIAENAKSLTFGWPRGAGALVLRQQGVEQPFTDYIEAGSTSPDIDLRGGGGQGSWATFGTYIPIGFDHILPKGLDHILFVLGLFFLSTRLRPLIWQVSAFTLAHTVTLALGALGWVAIPASIVEPLIAASIVYVAVENILTDGLSRWRPLVIFGFGLLHGLGFASVLGEYGLPDNQFFPALIGFNIGVELGQLTVIAIAFALLGYWFRDKPWYRARIAIPASVLIALVGGYWFVERVFL
ncbi:hypothetical protein SuNHUV7_33320 (plasmid) [Pseudoseohaeicola sp. NH-UV-7]